MGWQQRWCCWGSWGGRIPAKKTAELNSFEGAGFTTTQEDIINVPWISHRIYLEDYMISEYGLHVHQVYLCANISIHVVWVRPSRHLNKFDIKPTNMLSKWFWSESGPWWRGSSRGPLWAVSQNFFKTTKFKGNSRKDYDANICFDQVVVLRCWQWTVRLRTPGLEGCCEKIKDADAACVTRMKRVFEWPWLTVWCSPLMPLPLRENWLYHISNNILANSCKGTLRKLPRVYFWHRCNIRCDGELM